MLGWQLYLGAFLIKLLGFSFTAVRFSTVIEAPATAFLLQRTFLRAGINSCNATLVTVAFVLSPLYFPYVYTFMSDVSGVLCIVACIYMCLRAVQARRRCRNGLDHPCRTGDALGGTARQTGWFGVLVMVPCTVWPLRRSCAFSWPEACCAVPGWFLFLPRCTGFPSALDPPVSQLPRTIDFHFLKNVGRVVLGGLGVLTLYALPVLLLFAGALRLWNRSLVARCRASVDCSDPSAEIDKWPANAAFNAITFHTADRLDDLAAAAIHLTVARSSLRFLVTGAVVFGLICLVLFCLEPCACASLAS